MKIRYSFVLLMLVLPFTSAGLSGTISDYYVSKQPDCSVPLAPDDSFAAGDEIYVHAKYTNTGTAPLVNARVFYGDRFAHRPYNNGKHTYFPYNSLNIDVGETVELCYGIQTLPSYAPIEWKGVLFFRTDNQYQLDVKYVYYNMTNMNPMFIENINYTTNMSNPHITDPGEQIVYNVTFFNENQIAPFSGNFFLNPSRSEFLDGTYSKTFIIPPGASISFLLRNFNASSPQTDYQQITVNGNLGQAIIRKWITWQVTGDIYEYYVKQLFSNESVIMPGEHATASVLLNNHGVEEWNNSCCTYRWLIEGYDGAWHTILDETSSFSAPHVSGYDISYDTDFVNNLSTPLTEFKITLEVYKGGGMTLMDRTWQQNYVSYSTTTIPDITSSCNYDSIRTSTGILLNQTCDAMSNNIVFIEKQDDTLSSIKALSGSIIAYWSGEKDGKEGYFLKGSAGSVYELVYLQYKIFNLPAMNMSITYMVLSVLVFVMLLRFQRS